MSAQELPTGVVTLLLTDIEGSTKLWETQPKFMDEAMARHDGIFQEEVPRHSGQFPKDQGEGDSVVAAFALASDGVACALELQRRLAQEPWAHGPEGVQLRVRMALHTGEIDVREGNYKGSAINRCARIRAAAHGGQTLLSAATHDLVVDELPSGATVKDIGVHRLKDLSRPEHVYQLCHPDVQDDFPALRSLNIASNNLPEQLTTFIGREAEMMIVKNLLSKTRLLTLMGAGGAGKTRLSLQVAADLVDTFQGGVWFVDLAPVSDPMLVPQSVASAMGLRGHPGRSLTDAVVEGVGDGEALMIFDNCEHLVQQAAALGDSLLRRCPNLKILATSREALSVPGESTWRIPSLGLPESAEVPLDALSRFEAIRLFVDRATRVRPGFDLTERNAPAVLQICERLDGIPLAIELAAARVSSLAPEQIAERLDNRFQLLTGGSRTLLPRQQTLRALVEWSIQLLSEPEQVLLRRLSVFAGGFTIEAAEAVCVGGPVAEFDVLDLVSALVNKSLVIPDDVDDRRYRMLETIREYGRMLLTESTETSEISGRHLSWFVNLAEKAYHKLYEADQGVWLDALESEHDNIRTAISWSLTATSSEEGLRLAAHLRRFWRMRGFWQEGRRATETTLSRSPNADAALRARAHFGIGVFAEAEAEYSAARYHFEESQRLAGEAGDVEIESASLQLLADLAMMNGDYVEARRLMESSLEMRRAAGDSAKIADSLMDLGRLASHQGDKETAQALMNESLAMWRGMGNTQRQSDVRRSMAIVRGDFEKAKELLEKNLESARTVRDKHGTARFLTRLAGVALTTEAYTQALSLYREALEIQTDLGDRWGIGLSLFGMAEALLSLGNPERAAKLYGAADALREALGLSVPPVAQPRWEEMHRSLRDSLDEEMLTEADAAGREMSTDEAVAFAMAP